MTHCNFYHSTKLSMIILGDAAHATSPSIGMGMNHALADAACLDELLIEHEGDLTKVSSLALRLDSTSDALTRTRTCSHGHSRPFKAIHGHAR